MKGQQSSMMNKMRSRKEGNHGSFQGICPGNCKDAVITPITGKAIKGEADLVNKGQELLGCVHLKCLCQVSRTLGKG